MTLLFTRDFVDGGSYLFIPDTGNNDGGWFSSDGLVWHGPPEMNVHVSAEHKYKEFLGQNLDQLTLLSHFFQQTLSVPAAATWRHITTDILHRRNHTSFFDPDGLHALYRYLSTLNIVAFANDLRCVRKSQSRQAQTAEGVTQIVFVSLSVSQKY